MKANCIRFSSIVCAMVLSVFASSASAGQAARSSASAGASSSGSCEALAATTLPQAQVTVAQLVAAGALTGVGSPQQNAAFKQLPAFCRVAMKLTPSPDSDIRMELWLPTENWNGKFLAVGNGGWAGTISFDAMAAGLRRGYAAASNDTGHQDAGGRFALNRERLVDFAYRAMHEMTVQSKVIIRALYNRPPQLSYYQGCSTGGRQGMMEAQRYPDDFDAIIAGAPVYNMVHLNVSQTALQVEMLKNPERLVPESKVTLLANAAIAACDANDGVKDQIIENPRACKFDPGVLACKAEDATDCLTSGELQSARQLYTAVTTSGRHVYPGRSPGVEAGWAARIPVAGKPMNSLWSDMPRFVGRRDANWDPMTFDLEQDLALALQNGAFIEASDPDLSKFKARGGKLLLWHGWADPGPAPENTVDYHSQVVKTLGGGSQGDWMRLFLMPGVAHCGGGVGPDQADFLGAMEAWRERGVAPAQITASRRPGRSGLPPMSRPLCPFPQIAKYKGSGNTDDAASFVCAAP